MLERGGSRRQGVKAEERRDEPGLLPEIYPTPDTLPIRLDRRVIGYPTTYPTSPVPGDRYPNTYPSIHSKPWYHRWVARKFSKWGICSRVDTRHPIPGIPTQLDRRVIGYTRLPTRSFWYQMWRYPSTYPSMYLVQRAIPGYLPEESNYSGSKP
eukprot:scaffold28900_cov93-Cyclotella_meneghiniana.AAC.2